MEKLQKIGALSIEQQYCQNLMLNHLASIRSVLHADALISTNLFLKQNDLCTIEIFLIYGMLYGTAQLYVVNMSRKYTW